MKEDFIENLNKLAKIVELSIDIEENQKIEWLNLIESFKNSKNFDLNILITELTSIDINAYNYIFQRQIHRLSKQNIITYSTLAINHMKDRNVDNTLAFLENFNKNIHKVKPPFVKRVQKLKEKKGLLYVRQRSLSLSKERILNSGSNEVEIKSLMVR